MLTEEIISKVIEKDEFKNRDMSMLIALFGIFGLSKLKKRIVIFGKKFIPQQNVVEKDPRKRIAATSF